MSNKLLIAFIALLLAIPVSAKVVSDVPAFRRYNDGDTPTAEGYNADMQNVCNYINDQIAGALNVMTDTGDLYVMGPNGSLSVLLNNTAGDFDDSILTSDSTFVNNIGWEVDAGQSAVFIKGDLATSYGDRLTRQPVGLDNKLLTADSTSLTGMSWKSAAIAAVFPVGSIIAWSPAAAGTTTIPAGFLLCDGNNGTPNLIGLFVVGTRPPLDNSTPSTGGYGAQQEGTGTGTKTAHTHAVAPGTAAGAASNPVTTGQTPTGIVGAPTTAPTVDIGTQTHTHALTLNTLTTNSMSSNEPSAWSLCYLIKTLEADTDTSGDAPTCDVNYSSPESTLVSGTALLAGHNPYVQYNAAVISGPDYGLNLPPLSSYANGDTVVVTTDNFGGGGSESHVTVNAAGGDVIVSGFEGTVSSYIMPYGFTNSVSFIKAGSQWNASQ